MQYEIKVVAPQHLLHDAAQLAIKNIKTPHNAEFGSKVGDNWFFVRGIKAGVSVRHVSKLP